MRRWPYTFAVICPSPSGSPPSSPRNVSGCRCATRTASSALPTSGSRDRPAVLRRGHHPAGHPPQRLARAPRRSARSCGRVDVGTGRQHRHRAGRVLHLLRQLPQHQELPAADPRGRALRPRAAAARALRCSATTRRRCCTRLARHRRLRPRSSPRLTCLPAADPAHARPRPDVESQRLARRVVRHRAEPQLGARHGRATTSSRRSARRSSSRRCSPTCPIGVSALQNSLFRNGITFKADPTGSRHLRHRRLRVAARLGRRHGMPVLRAAPASGSRSASPATASWS